MALKSGFRYARRIGCFLIMVMLLAACGGTGENELSRPTLTVATVGTGNGTVIASDIDCGQDCTGSYNQGSEIALTATANSGSTFSGWSGDCSGETCTVTMDGNKTVTATFEMGRESQGKVLSGAATGWTAQDAVVRAETYNPDYIVLATSPVGEDGAFSLNLPGDEGVEAALVSFPDGIECVAGQEGGTATGTIAITPSQIGLATVDLYAYPSSAPDNDDLSYLGQFSYASEDFSVEVSQIYATSTASIKGDCTFTGTYEDPDSGETISFTDEVNYDLSLVAGWNDVITTFSDADANTFLIDIMTGAVPAGVTWQYFEATACVPGECEESLPLPCEDPADPGCETAGTSLTRSTLGHVLLPHTPR